MVPTRMLGLLACLSLAFGIAARARPMENLAGYGDNASSRFEQFLSADEAAALPTSSHQYQDQTLSGVPRLNSDPMSYLAGYTSGETGASTSSNYGQTSYGDHSGFPADVGGWHASYPPFQRTQAGFDGGRAVSADHFHAAAQHNLDYHQLAGSHLDFQPQHVSNPPFRYGPRSFKPSNVGARQSEAAAVEGLRAQLENADRYTSGDPPALVLRNSHDVYLKHPIAKSNVPTNMPQDQASVVRIGENSLIPNEVIRESVRSRFADLAAKGDPTLRAQWIDFDERNWPAPETGLRDALKGFLDGYSAGTEISTTFKSYMGRKVRPLAEIEPYFIDDFLIVMRRLQNINKHNLDRVNVNTFYHIAAVPLSKVDSFLRTGAGPGRSRQHQGPASYDFGVLMTSTGPGHHA